MQNTPGVSQIFHKVTKNFIPVKGNLFSEKRGGEWALQNRKRKDAASLPFLILTDRPKSREGSPEDAYLLSHERLRETTSF